MIKIFGNAPGVHTLTKCDRITRSLKSRKKEKEIMWPTLTRIGDALRDKNANLTLEQLPTRWVDLIKRLDEIEHQQQMEDLQKALRVLQPKE